MAIDRGQIDAELRDIGEGDQWWESREFRDLVGILHPHERLRALTVGIMLRRLRPRVMSGQHWLFVVTDQRFIALRRDRFARKQLEIAPGQALWVRRSNSLRGHLISIRTAERKYRIRLAKVEAFKFGTAVDALFPVPKNPLLDSELEPLSLIPGVSTLAALPGVHRVMGLLSPPEMKAAQTLVDQVQSNTDKLTERIERLEEQVAFLEELVRQRGGHPEAGTTSGRPPTGGAQVR